MKPQSTMIEEIREERPGYVGARLAKRAVTDCFARGVVRGGVETTNLTLRAGHPDPTRAESIKTAPVTDMALEYPLRLLAALREGRRWPQEPRRTRVDSRSNAHRKVTDCPFWTIYGGRGKRKEVHALSAYEFARHYYLKQARHPLTAAAHAKHLADPECYHAEITEAGQGKLKHYAVELTAGADYKIREAGCGDWLPLRDGEHAGPYRHDWVWTLRGRPCAPVVYGAQGGQSEDEQAARLLVLFFPMGQRRQGRDCAGPLHRRLLGPRRRRLQAGAFALRLPVRLPDGGGEAPGAELLLRVLLAAGAGAAGGSGAEQRQREFGGHLAAAGRAGSHGSFADPSERQGQVERRLRGQQRRRGRGARAAARPGLGHVPPVRGRLPA